MVTKLHRYKGKARRGFTLIELMVVIVTVAILAILVVSGFYRGRVRQQPLVCMDHLRKIGLSARTWSTEHNVKYPMNSLTNKNGSPEMIVAGNVFRVFQEMSNQISRPIVLLCPTDPRRPAADFSTLANTNLSYFVGLDADETMPKMILTGDRNVMTNGNGVEVGSGSMLTLGPTNTIGFSEKMHKFTGNVGLADGSVQQVTSAGFQTLLGRTGTNVNRLIVP